METVLFEVIFYDGRKYKVYCQGKNQIKRFFAFTTNIKNEIENISKLQNSMHTIGQFEKITTNLL